MIFPREERIMVRIIDLDQPDPFTEPRIEPLARIGLTAADLLYIIEKWDAHETAEIGHFRYEWVHE